LVDTLDAGPGYDVVVGIGADAPVAEFAAAGATWGIAGRLSAEETFEHVRARLVAGPPG
jgi:hypothetical protein